MHPDSIFSRLKTKIQLNIHQMEIIAFNNVKIAYYNDNFSN
jgi:hypothetical protein